MSILKKIKKYFMRVMLCIFFVLIFGILVFYALVVRGLSPQLQTLWVTTAMTTMSHQWLATSFIPDETIEKIMKENHVDDSKYNTDLSMIMQEENKYLIASAAVKVLDDIASDRTYSDKVGSVKQIMQHNQYIKEGYQRLEEGLYSKEISDGSWKGRLMLIQDSQRVHLVDTQYQFQKGETVMSMLQRTESIAGINGGGFCDTSNYNSLGETPAGLLIVNGEVISPKTNSDAVYNMIGFNHDGILILQHCTAEWAIKNRIRDAVSFSPFLIVNGEGTIKEGTGGWGIAPRTAIGQRASGEVIFLVIDGRQPTWSIGVDIKVVQDVLLQEGCMNAALLDGGSSTVMIYNQEFMNRPSLGYERWINNCWAVKKQ